MDFYERWEPWNGDLLYGLASSRGQYLAMGMAYAKPGHYKYISNVNGHFKTMIDKYNDAFGVSLVDNYAVDDPSTGSQRFDGILEQNFAATKEKLDQSGLDEHMRLIEQADAYRRAAKSGGFRFRPGTVFELSDEELGKELPGAEPRIEPLTAHDLNEARAQKGIRRACKLGIAIVATDPIFVRHGAKIHFALDHMDLGLCARKAPHVLGDGALKKPITTSEICYIFRYWEQLKKVVNFYVGMNGVAAPWEEDWEQRSIGNGRAVVAAKSSWDQYRALRVSRGRPARDPH
jgi:hypothetical protein